ncbi:MAG: hypothetical protein ACI9TH_000465 [Kiritimatiellia bacterium]|jgi:hypothetical protein
MSKMMLSVVFGFYMLVLLDPGLRAQTDQASAPEAIKAIAVAPAAAFSAQSVAFDGTAISASLARIAGELELIRLEMGCPLATPLGISIHGAHLHNVYFHAQALLEKSNRLTFEQTFTKSQLPSVTPVKKIVIDDVQALLDRVEKQLGGIKRVLVVSEAPLSTGAGSKVDASELLLTILGINKQINLLLERRYAPRDVYQKATLSVHYMARILDRFPDTRHIPEEPASERRKTPTDVFLRLHHCHELLVGICQTANLAIPELELTAPSDERSPSDVYDLAVLVVTDLAYLHTVMGDLDPPVRVLDPGRKFPSHVFQRVGLLEKQIGLLADNAARKADWIAP